MPDKRLITLEELHVGNDSAWKHDRLLTLLNSPFPAAFIKTNNNKPYAPIGKVKFMLTAIFRLWRLEIVEVKQVLNSMQATVRLHYLDPIDEVWYWQDGVGADKIQIEAAPKGTPKNSPIDFTKMTSDAIQKAAPSAVSYALKNAAQKIGTIFGGDLDGDEPLFEPFKPYQEEQKEIVAEAVAPIKEKAAAKQKTEPFDKADQQWDPKNIAAAQKVIAETKAPAAPSFNAPLQF